MVHPPTLRSACCGRREPLRSIRKSTKLPDKPRILADNESTPLLARMLAQTCLLQIVPERRPYSGQRARPRSAARPGPARRQGAGRPGDLPPDQGRRDNPVHPGRGDHRRRRSCGRGTCLEARADEASPAPSARTSSRRASRTRSGSSAGTTSWIATPTRTASPASPTGAVSTSHWTPNGGARCATGSRSRW